MEESVPSPADRPVLFLNFVKTKSICHLEAITIMRSPVPCLSRRGVSHVQCKNDSGSFKLNRTHQLRVGSGLPREYFVGHYASLALIRVTVTKLGKMLNQETYGRLCVDWGRCRRLGSRQVVSQGLP